jgi:hypothetical protein
MKGKPHEFRIKIFKFCEVVCCRMYVNLLFEECISIELGGGLFEHLL